MKFIHRFGAIFLIIAATFVVYAPALRNGFVWDDTALVLRDPLVRSWRLIPEGFGHFLFIDATGSNFYRPLQRLTFTADYAAWGFGNPGGWHFTSIAIHAAAAVALYALLRRLFGKDRWPVTAAIVWAVHPLHTSAVTYVAGRADLLAALFGFTGLWLALSENKRAHILAALCFLGAMLSKESGSMFLVIAGVVLAWRRAPWVRWSVLLVAVLSIYGTLRFTAHKTPPPQPRPSPLYARPALIARAASEYAGLIIAPVTLRMERDVRPGPAPLLLGVLLVAGGLWWCRRADSDTRLALTAATVAYLPISNLLPLNATVAEHWLYVPGAFLATAAALSLRRLPRAPVCIVLAAWTTLLAVRTWTRQADWRDQRTFLTRTIATGGDSARMRVNLGNLEASKGRHETALAEYAIALEHRPDLSFAHLGVAAAQINLGHFADARAALDRTAGLEAEKLQLRAALDFAEKNIDPVPSYRAAADLSPLNWPLRRRAITALAQSGRLPDAIRELHTFLASQDFRADSWLLLADLLTQAGQPKLADAAHAEAHRCDVRLAR
ncbi:MAG: hypothetical protein ABMA13_13315 [Chthoniobacteraceae bacterium]